MEEPKEYKEVKEFFIKTINYGRQIINPELEWVFKFAQSYADEQTKEKDKYKYTNKLHHSILALELKIKELENQRNLLLEALNTCANALGTYGSHPIIFKQVEKAIEQTKQK